MSLEKDGSSAGADSVAAIVVERSTESLRPAGKNADPCVVVIFGASGDLTSRKLVPALYNLCRDGVLPRNIATVGFARRDKTDASFRQELHKATQEHSRRKPIDEAVWQRFANTVSYHRGSFDDAAAYTSLRERLAKIDAEQGTKGNRIYYFATPPDQHPVILDHLKNADLIADAHDKTRWTRVIIEKPFGHDLASAEALNKKVASILDESQTFRIDHYLGKETVQNILIFRFANAIFEPLWNRMHIDHVQITAAEQIGLEGRANFYDATGIVRDVVQNHILQVLSLVAMEAPVSIEAADLRDERTRVLRSLRPIDSNDIDSQLVLGQYDGYRQEEGVDEKSRTPTFCALKAYIDNWRWQGVPFYIRAGKALKARSTEIAIHFKRVPVTLFGREETCDVLTPNVLTLRIQPDEGIALRFESKVPGEAIETATVTMDFSYKRAFAVESADAYERLLLACMRGDAALFLRRDAVEEAWRFVTPILREWETGSLSGRPPATYEKGSNGPRTADDLLSRDGRRWRDIG